MDKRDRAVARTPAALDRQYNIGGMKKSLDTTNTKVTKRAEQLLKEVEDKLNNVVTTTMVQEMIDASLGVIENGTY